MGVVGCGCCCIFSDSYFDNHGEVGCCSILNLFPVKYQSSALCVCVCVCEGEVIDRGGREKERGEQEWMREREREREI